MRTLIEILHEVYGEHTVWNAAQLLKLKQLERFVRADEREACAKLVEPSEEHRRDASWGYIGGEEGVSMLDDLAAGIRARGETK
jgi:hypothetical protein